MLTLFQFFFFIWALFVSLPAFVALAAWLIALLVLLKKEAVGNNGLILAAAIFSPLMIFITCKLQDRFLGGWQPSTEGEVMPHAVFSTVLIWELPLRGFLLITTLHFAAILVCCWLMLRRHPRTLSNQVT
jgi:hypothetical protein